MENNTGIYIRYIKDRIKFILVYMIFIVTYLLVFPLFALPLDIVFYATGLCVVFAIIGSFFMIATVLTIYYKQISEGYDDQYRFEIMQKVGMSKDEVKATINSQVKVNKVLTLFNMTNTKLFLSFTGIVILIFASAYFIVYKLTAKVYYKIVR